MKNIILALIMFTSIGLAPVAINSGLALAQIQDGIDATCPGGVCPDTNPEDSVNALVAQIINILSWAVGVISVIMIMVGGFKYVTSNGDNSKVTSGKNTIIYALIGLAIVALSQIIVQFVLDLVIPPPAP